MGMTASEPESLPSWWAKNKQLKEELGLPSYEPPRFLDGTYVHNIIPEIEDEYDITVRLQGINTNYPDEWTVSVNHKPLFQVGRRRDNNGNTVYQLSAEEFRERFSEEITSISNKQ